MGQTNSKDYSRRKTTTLERSINKNIKKNRNIIKHEILFRRMLEVKCLKPRKVSKRMTGKYITIS